MFKKRSEHIGLEDLSEYLDGRLVGGRLDQVEVHLASCVACKEELRSLEYTVGLLQQVPLLAPRRRVAIQNVPVAVPGWGFRMPSWAYGAAASVAIMLFAMVIAADLGGWLTGYPRQQATVATSQVESQAAPESPSKAAGATPVGVEDEGADDLIKNLAAQDAEIELPFGSTQPSFEAGASTQSAPPALETDAPIESAFPVFEADTPFESAPSVFGANQPDESVLTIVPGDHVESENPRVEEPTFDQGRVFGEGDAISESEADPRATEERIVASIEDDSELDLPVDGDVTLISPRELLEVEGGTSAIWRVLEGVLGGMAALVLVVWRLRRYRKDTV